MNFGAFAGGFAQGLDTSMRIGKNIRDLIKETKLQELREKGMAEAEAQRAKSVQDMIKEQGVQATDAPTSGPIDTSMPTVETPQTAQQVSASSPTASPDAASAKTAAASMAPASPAAVSAASPTANPDPAGAATAAASGAPGAAPAQAEPATTATVQPTPAQTSQAQLVQATPQQAAAAAGVPGATKPPKFFVNGIGYETREQAMAAANREAPSAMDLFMKNAAPQIAQQYLVNGDPATAKAWTDYAESQTGKRAIKDWAAAYSAPDFDTAVTRFGKYYTDHINDGVDYTGHKMLTKEDGTQVAVVTLKDKATGKTTEMELTREKMIALGGANNPQKLFEMEQAKQREAEKIKLEAQLKAKERREKTQDTLVVEGYKADRQDKREGIKQDRLDQRERIKASLGMEEAKGKAQIGINTKIDALIGAGYGEEEIKKMMPAIVGAGEHKRTTDPTERRALIASDLVKNDPSFSRQTPEQQNKKIDDLMGVIYGGEKADAAKPDAKGTSAIADTPMAYDPKLPVKYNKTTGKPYHYVNGKYVPIQGTIPPQAGGMPQR